MDENLLEDGRNRGNPCRFVSVMKREDIMFPWGEPVITGLF